MSEVVVTQTDRVVVVQESPSVIKVTEPGTVVVRHQEPERIVMHEPKRTLVIVDHLEPGPAVSPQVAVGPVLPSDLGDEFLWVQTGLGEDGSGFTIWFDDGLP